MEGTFYPEDGQYIVLTVTNNGSATQTVMAGRALTLGGFEKFTSVDIGAGETLTRAFSIADGAEELESTLAFGVYAKGVSGFSDITVYVVYPGAIAKILNADTFIDEETNLPHANWAFLTSNDERIDIMDDMEPLEITGDMLGVYDTESSIYVLGFEMYDDNSQNQ